jgi:hypothetical protein
MSITYSLDWSLKHFSLPYFKMLTWICLNYWPPKIIDDEFYFYFFIVIITIFFLKYYLKNLDFLNYTEKQTVQIINATNFQHNTRSFIKRYSIRFNTVHMFMFNTWHRFPLVSIVNFSVFFFLFSCFVCFNWFCFWSLRSLRR